MVLNSSIPNKPWNSIKFTELADYFAGDILQESDKNKFILSKFDLEKIWPDELQLCMGNFDLGN